jgi:hypothetical protein
MRAPVNVEVSNVPLAGLADRLAAAAEVPIVVESLAARDVRVSAELKNVPLFRALETVAAEAKLVIAPRPGGITLQSQSAGIVAPSRPDADPPARPQGTANATTVWSPDWGPLPQQRFALLTAKAPATAPLGRQSDGTGASGAPGGAAGRAAPPVDQAVAHREQDAAVQERAVQTQAKSQQPSPTSQLRGQVLAQKAQSQVVPVACPHCRRALSTKQPYRCPRCRHSVKPRDARCAHCSQAAPARCPHCGRALLTGSKEQGSAVKRD